VRGMRVTDWWTHRRPGKPSASMRGAAATRRGRDDPRRGSRPSSRA
jgi:hypothetical protein